jgi:hypothetical protein
MIQSHRVAMRAHLLEGVGDVVETDLRFVSGERTGNPPKASIGDHHEGPPSTRSIQVSSFGHVFAPPDRDHALTGQ